MEWKSYPKTESEWTELAAEHYRLRKALGRIAANKDIQCESSEHRDIGYFEGLKDMGDIAHEALHPETATPTKGGN